jgi:Golgi phosphoprotein 3 GPP34
MTRSHLAENFFLIVHDPFTGRPSISRELLDCGLVAAELADLVLSGHLDVVDDRVVVTDRAAGREEELPAFVLESVSRQKSAHTVRVWSESIGEIVFDLVVKNLLDSGVVRTERQRTVLRRGPQRFPAQDLLRASGPRLRLEHMLRTPSAFDLPGAVTAAIVGALGLERTFEVDVDRELFVDVTHNLPPTLERIIAGVAATVAAISLTVRR